MAASIFNGSAVKILKDILRFKSGVELTATQVGYLNTITSDVQTQLDAKVDESREGQNNGIATLDAGGKIPAAQLPNSIMDYLGTWAASTNTPTLANGTGNAGDVYIASDSGSVDFGAGSISFVAGDWVVYSGSVWQKSINSNAVVSVNTQTGAVVLDTDDISEGGSNLYFTDGRAQSAITGAASTIVTSNLTVDRALASDGSGKVSATSVTATELGYVSGVTSSIQTQLNGKQATITGAATSIVSADLTASRALESDVSGKVAASSVTSTELSYVSGVTSAIQTQLNGKQAAGNYANDTLSNLGTTDINADFIFNKSDATVKTKDSAAAITPNLLLKTGDGTGFASGTLSLISGTSSTAATGNVYISSGNKSGSETGASGSLTLISGEYSSSSNSKSGDVVLRSGDKSGSGTAATGDVLVRTGASSSVNGPSGLLTLKSGDQTGAGTATSGTVTLKSGDVSGGNKTSGVTTISTGTSGSGNSGSVQVTTGTPGAGFNSGAINLQTGSVSGGTRGNITLNANLVTSASSFEPTSNNAYNLGSASVAWASIVGIEHTVVNAGSVYSRWQHTSTTPSGVSVNAALTGGDINSSVSRSLGIWTSNASSTTQPFYLETGNGTGAGGASGLLQIKTGNNSNASSPNNTGSISILTGNAAGSVSGDSGSITLQTGTSAAGARGSVVVNALQLNMSTSRVINMADPVNAQDAATKAYADTKQDRAALTTKGDLYVATASNTTTRMPAGTDGTFLKADSSVANGLVYASNAQIFAVRSITGTDTLNASTDDIALLSGASFTLDLPTAVGNTGKRFTIKHVGTSLTQVYTVDGNASETIDGTTTYALYTNGETLVLVSDGSNWQVIEHRATTDWIDAGAISIDATTTAPTKPSGIDVDKFYWKREGKDLVCRFEYKQNNTTSGADGSGDYLFTAVPSGITIDTSVLAEFSTVQGAGTYVTTNNVGSFSGIGATINFVGIVSVYDSTQVRFMFVANSGEGAVGSAGGGYITQNANMFYVASFRIPISEFRV